MASEPFKDILQHFKFVNSWFCFFDLTSRLFRKFVKTCDELFTSVLILSPFAGAGGLMHEAIMANPYETHITAAGKTLM